MPFIQIRHLNFSYKQNQKLLFTDLSLNLHAGWTSICGANGSGKTTLLKIIEKQLPFEMGQLDCQGKLVSVPQSTEEPPPELEEFQWDYSKAAIRFREELRIGDDWGSRWKTLSIGERKRLQLAVALCSGSEILLVDEPTNHVDSRTKEMILSALSSYKGVGVLVSHDRLLLNHLCEKTVFLEGGKALSFSAPYEEAKKEKDSGQKQKLDLKNKLKHEQKRLSQAAQAQQEKVEQGRKLLSKKNISNKDHDAKEKINRAKLFGAGLSDSRSKKTLQSRVEKITEERKAIELTKKYEMGVFFQNTPRVKNVLFEEEVYKLPFLEIHQPRLALGKGDKLALTGENGAGKSTLLGLWLKKLPKPYAYAPQEFSEEEKEKLTEEILSFEKDKRGKIFTLVSCLGSSPKALAEKSPPSPGVWQKLMIAKAIVEEVPLLILDEPTNHLDLPSLEVLEEALCEYEGMIICISHDKDFIKRVCNKRFHLKKKSRDPPFSEAEEIDF